MLTLIVLLLLTATGLCGQRTLRLTLEECIQRAIVHHPRLGLSEGELRISQSRLKQARAVRTRPQAQIHAMVGPVPAARGDPTDPDLRNDFNDMAVFTRAELSVVQPIYTFGKLEGQVAAARHGVEASREARLQVINEIRRETRERYYSVLLARGVEGVLSSALDDVDTARVKVAESMERGDGQFTSVDQYRLEVFASELRARQAKFSALQTQGLTALKAVIGLDATTHFDLADSSLETPVRTQIDPNSASREALADRPELERLRAGNAARSELVRSAKGDRYPHLFAGGALRYGFAPNRTDQRNPFVRDDFNLLRGGVAVGFRYSLDFASNRAKVEEAEGELQRVQAQQKLTETVVDIQARNAASSLAAAELITDIRVNSARMARAWLTAAESTFSLGLGDTRDLVEAFEAYVLTRGALLEAVYLENVAQAEFDFAKGGT